MIATMIEKKEAMREGGAAIWLRFMPKDLAVGEVRKCS